MEKQPGALENLDLAKGGGMLKHADFWRGKKVFLTGHTGFKGSWLALWLTQLGAEVSGFALAPPTYPNLFQLAEVGQRVHSIIGDVRDREALQSALQQSGAEIVLHLAAQALVRDSYAYPIETFAINVMGTAHLLESVRKTPSVKAVVNVTTDKCYENREWVWGYREDEALGGFDPYSSSKACSELVTAAFRRSFFHPDSYSQHGVAVATARAGNVIGGGDWGKDRLIPDCLNWLLAGETISLRNPGAIRPWQHVLEPLSGYLLLAQRLYEQGPEFVGAWNFGPEDRDARPVLDVVSALCHHWGEANPPQVLTSQQPHEAQYLKLDCSKAKSMLGWVPRLGLDQALVWIVEWTKANARGERVLDICLEQISRFDAMEG